MSKRSWALLLIPLVTSPAWSKGPVVRIEIRDAIHTPLVITDAAIVDQFNLWIMDQPAEAARQRAQGLPRFEVADEKRDRLLWGLAERVEAFVV